MQTLFEAQLESVGIYQKLSKERSLEYQQQST